MVGAPTAIVLFLVAGTVLRLARARAPVVGPPVALSVGAGPAGPVGVVVGVAGGGRPGGAVVGLSKRPVQHAAVLHDQNSVAP